MRVHLVAAFAEAPFRGNPAGVCLLSVPRPAADLQAIARELNQPETAFVWPLPGGAWAIRWFSPKVEVDLCGHATLASAHILWSEGFAGDSANLCFVSSAGELGARRDPDGLIWLDFPALGGHAGEPPPGLLEAVALRPLYTARHADRWLFEYGTAAEVRAMRPDFGKLLATGVRSLIVTAPSDIGGYDIISRNFAPLVGVDEDQVTGMAHTCLAPHWQVRLGGRLRCWQASQRGGALHTWLSDDRVWLGGRAVTTLAGEWRAP